MITYRVSIIFDDKNLHYRLINKAVKIIKDKYNCEFDINGLTSLKAFSTEEKGYLRRIFSTDIFELDIWREHHFYFIKNVWEYHESSYYDYRRTVWIIMRLLNNSKIPLGKKVYTNDYELIENLWRAWNNLWNDGIKDVQGGNRIYDEVNYAVIEFISHNLKTRVGGYCRFDFEFVKAFMEARHDYYTKKISDAIMGIESCNN